MPSKREGDAADLVDGKKRRRDMTEKEKVTDDAAAAFDAARRNLKASKTDQKQNFATILACAREINKTKKIFSKEVAEVRKAFLALLKKSLKNFKCTQKLGEKWEFVPKQVFEVANVEATLFDWLQDCVVNRMVQYDLAGAAQGSVDDVDGEDDRLMITNEAVNWCIENNADLFNTAPKADVARAVEVNRQTAVDVFAKTNVENGTYFLYELKKYEV